VHASPASRRSVVLRFATFKSAGAAMRYFVEEGAECARSEAHVLERADGSAAVDYYSEGDRVVGEWHGDGAAALGLTGPITGDQIAMLTGLLEGRSTDGVARARPVWRPHPDGRLPVTPLVDATRAAASGRGVRIDQLLDSDGARSAFAKLSSRAERDPAAAAHPQTLADLANVAGVDMNTVFGAGSVAFAFAHADTKVDVRRAGAQGAVSAPKSVSLLWALGDHHTGQQVLDAHRTAVKETVAYLERWAGHALRGHQGDGHRATQIGTDGLIVAAFEHLTSRADDPQLHTHLVIANVLHGTDGKWSSLDTRALFRAQRTAGYLYQAVLRGELTARLGLGWGPVRNGMAEVAGLPRALLREFSTRRRAIEAHQQRVGTHGVKAAQVACLQTRPAKSGKTVGELLAGWWDRALVRVPDPTASIRAVLHRAPSLRLRQVRADEMRDRLLGPDGVTRTRTGFDRGDLTRDLLEDLPSGTQVTHADLEAVVDDVLASPQVLPLIPDAYGTRRYTTAELTSTEAGTLRLAQLQSAITPAWPLGDVRRLSAEQLTAVSAITTSTSTVDVVLGPAGAGKTAMLAALHEHYRRLHIPVAGACLAAVAARRLESSTAIASTSLAQLLHRIRAGTPLPYQSVVVLDEAGMIGTRDFHTLLSAISAVDGKLVAVGDRAQLTEIDAGGMFARLSRSHLATELTDNHRQTQPWERDALTAIRTGQVHDALTTYRRHGRLHAADTHPELVDRIATTYLNELDAGTSPTRVIALAASRAGAATLNAAIRGRLHEAGRIGDDVTVDGEAFAVAELVMVTRNDHTRGLLNGTRATVTDITTRTVTLATEDRRTERVAHAWAAERLRPAYAMTVHKAQGLTVDTALVDTTAITDRNTGYVALSRARLRTEIHYAHGADLEESLHDDPFTPVRRRPQPADVDRVLAVRLRGARQQRLASTQLSSSLIHDPGHRSTTGRDVGLSR